MIEIIQLMAIVILTTCVFMLVKPTKKMTQQEKRYAVSNRAGESPKDNSSQLTTKPVQTVENSGTEEHKHVKEVPQGYVNLNGKLIKREDLEKYQ